MESTTIAGEYYLEGVREMASGFLLKPDKTFQFFFTYGALDRQGAGTWKEKAGQVILSSNAKPADGYALVKAAKKDHDFIHVKLEGNNPMALRHTFVSLEDGKEGSWKQMDQQGNVQFPLQKLTSISLLLEFCPEKITTIPVSNKEHNEFLVRIEPSIIEVFFEDFSLKIEEHALAGGHPLLQDKIFRYAKQ